MGPYYNLKQCNIKKIIRDTMADKRVKGDSYKNNKKCSFSFSPKDITIKDDAFHSSKSSRFTEWWYFDAVFDKGYSAQLSVRVLSIIKKRLVLIFQRLDIYKDGKLVKHSKIRHPLRKFDASKSKPRVKLDNKTVIEGKIDKSGKMIYNLSFDMGEYGADLNFEGITKGFKGKVPASPGGDWWAVVLPRANVTGNLKIKNEKIKVKATGDHDHNWEVKGAAALKNLGWLWGKINTKKYTLTWATIFKNINIGQALLVINKKDGGYINVKREDITFIAKDLHLSNKKRIPNEIIIQAKNDKVYLNFNMKVLDIHHVKLMIIMNYWRFHLMCEGKIKIGSDEETIKSTQIAEFLRFK